MAGIFPALIKGVSGSDVGPVQQGCGSGFAVVLVTMAAVGKTEPLREPCTYQRRFRVDVNIKKPLQPIQLSSEQVAVEIWSLCFQLDLLIRAEVHQLQEQLREDKSPVESESFHIRGVDYVERIKQYLEHLPDPVPQLEDYLDSQGLSTLFPRVEIFVIHGRPVDMLERPPMDDYFSHIGKLNQLLVLSQQLEDDVQHLGSHKYIAHQLSVLYKVLNYFSGSSVSLDILKKDIEANFKALKSGLAVGEGTEQEPLLPFHYVNWILSLTRSITTIVSSLPEELTEEMSLAMSLAMNLR
ncbi:uncharacterized protein si:ch211-218d20.15 [Scyliorhinus canicula]|uniref:uncharacterized protein si:ch211-218d20.15 n=1 Tax=Scyliorhinus canicula TaxID=7830 RepID=UPI0018F4E6CD|nr:uncharacterized protein si:ch211-218d20.15 [Scyliorhinus canicula]